MATRKTSTPGFRLTFVLSLIVALAARGEMAVAQEPASAPMLFQTPVQALDLDPTAFSEWVAGTTTPVIRRGGEPTVIWTQSSAPDWEGVRFGDSKTPGLRYLRIGFTRPISVGAVLVHGGGELSVLKSTATNPGDLADDKQWIPAVRLVQGKVASHAEVGEQQLAVWILPPGASTRALRFAHRALSTDQSYAGWLGGAYVLSDRLVNLAPQAAVAVSAESQSADKITNESIDGTWLAWDNGQNGAQQVISPEHPEWIMLIWPRPVSLRGLAAIWAGFESADVQAYTGPADRHPREAHPEDWKKVHAYTGLQNMYPGTLGVNWLDFGATITTRAIRLRMTHVTEERHPHVVGKAMNGKRVWLGELMALKKLDSATLASVIDSVPATTPAPHPPIPIRFALKEAGYVTLVLDDASGKRIRNLVSETYYPAGANVAWWDGTDDLTRDQDAARHGIYHIPEQFVSPGVYHMRGLYRKALNLTYEFSIYNAGTPAWETEDHTGAWLTTHTPASATLFIPANRAPNGRPLVYIGCYVAEGGHGLAWVDSDGRKVGGQAHVGGSWTGAPYMASDATANAAQDTILYVGAAWENNLVLTALTRDGEKPVLDPPLRFPGDMKNGRNPEAELAGIAVHNRMLIASLPKQNQLVYIDISHRALIARFPLKDPRGVIFQSDGHLLALSGSSLIRYRIDTKHDAEDAKNPLQLLDATTLATGLDDPQGIAVDSAGSIYVSEWGDRQDVKVFDATGKLLRTIGHPGPSKAGPYDTLHMNHPRGLTVDAQSRLWVAEEDFQPKRVSVWLADGSLWKGFYGPARYGGGGTLDPVDRSRFYYDGMEFHLDWKAGTDSVTGIIYRPGASDLKLPDGFGVGGAPETAIYHLGHQYMTNCFDSNPTNGTPFATIWIMRDGIAHPVAAAGLANSWDLLKTERFRACWPAGVDPSGDVWKNQTLVIWSDLNGDGQVQPEELQMIRVANSGVTVGPDLSFQFARVDHVPGTASEFDFAAVRFTPVRYSASGTPVYNVHGGKVLTIGTQSPVSSGGDQILNSPDGWTIHTIAPKPFAPESLGGSLKGVAKWSYPSLWPGLHASHESAVPDRPGELVGTTRLLGGFINPTRGDSGPLWCINANMGNMYLFTEDGLFVATLFHDGRAGQSWSMPTAIRGANLNALTLHDENFWPTITQTSDGKVYLVDGARMSLVQVQGLETISRLPSTTVTVTADQLKASEAISRMAEAERQKREGRPTLKIGLRSSVPSMSGRLEEWTDVDWVDIDKKGTSAYFDSNSRPYNVSGTVTVAGDNLYAAFRTGDKELLRNTGETLNAPFKTGGALDLMIGTDPSAPETRSKAVAGDIRLLVTMVKNRPYALLYRAVAPHQGAPVPFSSPSRTITFDSVENVSDSVVLVAKDGDYSVSVPLSVLGLKPAPGLTLRGDIGILRGNGFQTMQRVYWCNKATGITADVPSEAELTPALWGIWRFE